MSWWAWLGLGFVLGVVYCIALWKFVLEPAAIREIESWRSRP